MKKLDKIIKRVLKIKNIEYIFFSLILLAGLVVRLYKIDSPIADWHSFRQADTASVTRTYVGEGVNLLYPRYHDISTTQSGLFNPNGYRFVEFPIFNVIHAFLIKLYSGISLEVWGRLLSIFSALISTYIIFLLGKRYIGVWGGLVAAGFYALLPFNIYFTRVILPEPMSVTFALASLWFFVKYIDKEKYKYLYAASVLTAVALLVKPYAIFYTVPMFYLAIRKFGVKGMFRNKNLVIAAGIVLVPVIFWRIWMQQFPEGIPFWKWTFNGDGIRFRPSFWRWIFGERLTKLILGYWGLIPFSFGLLLYKRGKAFIHAFLLGMFLYVVIIATANVRHDYYQTIVIPAISLAFAAGVVFLWKGKGFNKIISRGVLIFSAIIMLITSAYEVREFYKINHPEIIKAGEAVDRIVEKDALVIAAYNGDTAFLYQTKRWGWPVVDRPINELIDKGASYYVSVNLSHPQTLEFMQDFEVVEKTEEYVIVKLK
jgi:4-amino-4-deoxy-L-arabinose transferase-like glycosyltransferase